MATRRVEFLVVLEVPDPVIDSKAEIWLIDRLKGGAGPDMGGPVGVARIARATALQRLERAPGAIAPSPVADAANAVSLAQEKDLT